MYFAVIFQASIFAIFSIFASLAISSNHSLCEVSSFGGDRIWT